MKGFEAKTPGTSVTARQNNQSQLHICPVEGDCVEKTSQSPGVFSRYAKEYRLPAPKDFRDPAVWTFSATLDIGCGVARTEENLHERLQRSEAQRFLRCLGIVPEGRTTVARRFIAGLAKNLSGVPEGRLNRVSGDD